MIRQRRSGSAPVVQASATDLPFRDGAFSAAMAVLTIHHWPDRVRGLAEMARVAQERVVVLTWDPESDGFWLVQDYFPGILEVDRRILPPLAELRRVLGPLRVVPVPIPHDCRDGFLGAYWRRPSAYLDPRVRGGMSTFAKLPGMETGLERLRADLEDGTWERRHGGVLNKTELDVGYRLVVWERKEADPGRAPGP
jgi:SAM-dependent methyltransferase